VLQNAAFRCLKEHDGRNVDCLTAQFLGSEGRTFGVPAVEQSVRVAREADGERRNTAD